MADNETVPPSLRVVQAVAGVFHHFDLAREFAARGCLARIYSTFPWRRLRREGIPRNLVRSFPWIHTPQLLIQRWWQIPATFNNDITVQMFRSFDAWIARSLPPCDIYVALSGSGVVSGRRAQQLGAKYICDRGSSHIRYQNQIVGEEYARWGFPRVICDPRMIAREETEYEQADVITVPSEFSRRSFMEMGVPADKIRRIPLGVRLERFRQTGAPPADSFEVLFVGGVNLRKGVPYLLQAFAQLRHPRKRLRIVGGIDAEMRQLLPRLPQENVEFLGHMPQPQLAEVMSTSHVMVLPSVEDGFGMVMAQAMSCGCPVLSTWNTGGPDLYENGKEGFIIEIRSQGAICEKLQQLADDPKLQQAMSEASMNRVRQLGGWQQYGDAWADFIEETALSQMHA